MKPYKSAFHLSFVGIVSLCLRFTISVIQAKLESNSTTLQLINVDSYLERTVHPGAAIQEQKSSPTIRYGSAAANQLKFPARRRSHGNAQQEICRVSATKEPRAALHFLFHLANLHQSGPEDIPTRHHLCRRPQNIGENCWLQKNPGAKIQRIFSPCCLGGARAFVAFRLIPSHGCYDLLYLLTLRHCLFEGLKAFFKRDEGVCLPPVGSSSPPVTAGAGERNCANCYQRICVHQNEII